MHQPLNGMPNYINNNNNNDEKIIICDKECILCIGIIIFYNVSFAVIMMALINSESSNN